MDQHNLAIETIKNRNNVLITGSAGTGKTFFINSLYDYFTKEEPNTSISFTSLTGVSTILLKNGCTLHSYLGFGINTINIKYMVGKINQHELLKKNWNVDILVIDESSMLSDKLIDKIDEIAKIIRNNDLPFGGICLVLVGDFYQLPPVQDNYLFLSKRMKTFNFQIIKFEKNFRQADETFLRILEKCKFGTITKKDWEYIKNNSSKTNNINGVEFVKLLSTNKQVNSYNSFRIKKLNNEIKIFNWKIYPDYNNMKNIIDIYKSNNYNENNNIIFEKITNSRTTMIKNLELCIGSQVMLLKNMSHLNLYNGSIGIITGWKCDEQSYLPIVKFDDNEVVVSEYYLDIFYNNINIGRVKQIPLKLCYAITIHKSQGQTLDYCNINISNVFTFGQAYVAISRVKKLENLYIEGGDETCFHTNPDVVSFFN
jgi:ATP-dependent DNA helicase PIF1